MLLSEVPAGCFFTPKACEMSRLGVQRFIGLRDEERPMNTRKCDASYAGGRVQGETRCQCEICISKHALCNLYITMWWIISNTVKVEWHRYAEYTAALRCPHMGVQCNITHYKNVFLICLRWPGRLALVFLVSQVRSMDHLHVVLHCKRVLCVVCLRVNAWKWISTTFHFWLSEA